ncbi:hypothetical protein [Zavarzinella formosa]|uniref:hypothetical protein n=1 Tax=Zavarzinella formosa TaxID=360055 RepID=UPI0002F973FA|nr:hypothetical protein [Zavarzinella formosa]
MSQTSKPVGEEVVKAASALGRTRQIHPAFEGTDDLDPLTARLTTLMRLHPEVTPLRPDNLSGMDSKAKKELLSQFEKVLGLTSAKDAPVIPLS